MRRYFHIVPLCLTSLFTPLWGQEPWVTNGNTISYTGGSVGIGTTTPTFQLQTRGIIAADQGNNVMVLLGQTAGASAFGTSYGGIWYDTGSNSLRIDALSGGVAWRNVVLNGNGAGNVGIGTTSPAAMLHISNSTTFNPASNTKSSVMVDGSYGGGFLFKDGAGYLGMWSTGGGTQLNFKTGGTSTGFGGPYGSMVLDNNGNLGLGTMPLAQYRLAVSGTIGAKEVVVTNTGWSDYVFRPGYRLQPLREVAVYIREQGHLPEIPTEKEVKEQGVSLGQMQSKLLAKIEELTLHLIEAEERNTRLEERLARLEAQPKPQSPKAQ